MEDIKEVDEPIQIPNKKFKFDLNMLCYGEKKEEEFNLDWNKLYYGENQISEFIIKQNANYMKPECYSYLFQPELTAWEEHLLKEKGVDLDSRVIPEEPVFLVSKYIPKHEEGANGECGIHEDVDRTVFGEGVARPSMKKSLPKPVRI